jgi:hypothetical protein
MIPMAGIIGACRHPVLAGVFHGLGYIVQDGVEFEPGVVGIARSLMINPG